MKCTVCIFLSCFSLASGWFMWGKGGCAILTWLFEIIYKPLSCLFWNVATASSLVSLLSDQHSLPSPFRTLLLKSFIQNENQCSCLRWLLITYRLKSRFLNITPWGPVWSGSYMSHQPQVNSISSTTAHLPFLFFLTLQHTSAIFISMHILCHFLSHVPFLYFLFPCLECPFTRASHSFRFSLGSTVFTKSSLMSSVGVRPSSCADYLSACLMSPQPGL